MAIVLLSTVIRGRLMSEDIIILTNKGIIVTREEQIKHALSKYIKDRGVSGNHIVDVERDAAFIAGALWADKNSDLSSLWHDASEMPLRTSCEILYEMRSNYGFQVAKVPDVLTADIWENVLKVCGIVR